MASPNWSRGCTSAAACRLSISWGVTLLLLCIWKLETAYSKKRKGLNAIVRRGVQPEFCMAQVGTPVGVRKPVLWEPNSNLGSPLHGEARREDERAVRGGRGERGGAVWIAICATGALPRTSWANHLRYLTPFYYGKVLVEP